MSLEIRDLRQSDLSEVARIHIDAFPKSALTQLGHEAIRRYYDWLAVGPHDSIAIGAFHNEALVAFLFGGRFNGAMTGFLHRDRWYLVGLIARRPSLLATSLIRDRVSAGLRLLWRRARPAPQAPDRGPRAFGVLAIAVDPKVQRTGAGKALMLRAESAALETGFTTMELTVADWNTNAISFYEHNGWAKVLSDGIWRQGLMRKVLA